MISKAELLQGRDSTYASEYNQTISDNLDALLIPINGVRTAYDMPMTVSSGWRPPSVNSQTTGSAVNSKHLIGLAVDILDYDSKLMNWVLDNLSLMQTLGLFFEDFNWTSDWVHFQLGQPKSGKRIFIPNANRPTCNRWNGVYEHMFDVGMNPELVI